jgi:protein-tyrosine phosphatase
LTHTKRILFVCLGNIVRSPLAEALFLSLAAENALGHKYEADSAGTGGWHAGELPDERMRHVAAQHDLQYTHRARKVERTDISQFDWVIAMDRDNRASLMSLAVTPKNKAKIRLLREFDPQGGPEMDVPDPYYERLDGFEYVYGIVERSCRQLLQELEEGKL